MNLVASINGQLGLTSYSSLSPFDRGFMLGDGLFETMLVVDGTVWYLDRHLDRLRRGAECIGILVPPALRQWIDAVVRHATDAGETTFVVRVIATRGVAHTQEYRFTLAGNSTLHSTIVILAFDVTRPPAAAYDRGLHAQLASARRDERALSSGLKTTSYIEPVLALRTAIAAGFDDAIFLDTRGFVAETSSSNIFIWTQETLVTPPLTCGILPGITRRVVLELASQTGVRTAEREFTLDELVRAEEAFLTSSLRGIIPLVGVDQHAVGHGRSGALTHSLAATYAAIHDRT